MVDVCSVDVYVKIGSRALPLNNFTGDEAAAARLSGVITPNEGASTSQDGSPSIQWPQTIGIEERAL